MVISIVTICFLASRDAPRRETNGGYLLYTEAALILSVYRVFSQLYISHVLWPFLKAVSLNSSENYDPTVASVSDSQAASAHCITGLLYHSTNIELVRLSKLVSVTDPSLRRVLRQY
jgi:hypothetical protein